MGRGAEKVCGCPETITYEYIFSIMRKIIIIGTLHAGLTPNQELKEFLEYTKPTQVLVEILEEDLHQKKLDSYPSEMVYTLKWAKQNYN